MKKILLLGLVVFAAAGTSGLQAQEADLAGVDSIRQAARTDGIDAARAEWSPGYAAVGFLGGLPLGFFGPAALFAGLSDTTTPGLIAFGGASTIFAATNRARRGTASLSPELFARVSEEGPEYREVFEAAYRGEVRARNGRYALQGGALGVAVGLGVLVLALDAAFGGAT